MKRIATNAVPLLAALVLAASGCGTPKLDRAYGRSSGASINGTRVFYDLLVARGHEVRRVATFQHTYLKHAQVLVWFERDPDGVPWYTVEDAAQWLEARPGRILLYVANDFDADVHLWGDLADHFHEAGPPELEVRARAYQAKASDKLERRRDSSGATGGMALYPFAWSDALPSPSLAADLEPGTPLAHDLGAHGRVFVSRHPSIDEPPAPKPAPGEVSPGEPEPFEPVPMPREGDSPITVHAHPVADETVESDGGEKGEKPDAEPPGSKRMAELRNRIEPGADVVQLASNDGTPLVLERSFGVGGGARSRVMLVHNGSFLLNYAVLDPAHRTLAARLADLLGTKQQIAFLEPARGGLTRAWFPGRHFLPYQPNPLTQLIQPPFGWVFLHLLIAALIYLAYKAPIFGRPRGDSDDAGAPFTQHVRAYGKLLERTGDRRYADEVLAEAAALRSSRSR